MKTDPLIELLNCGQSVWYDNIRRALITSGDLKRMVENDGLRGITSNPTIFEKAIAGSGDYDEALAVLIKKGWEKEEIYEELAISDIQQAADLFTGLYLSSAGLDGYVSLEVSPLLARNTAGTIREAHRLWETVKRPNVMIKVPATSQGIPAIEHLIGEGVNVNVTLIFSEDCYAQVAGAYIAGLEKLQKTGKPLSTVASVASFFVSRIDSAVDKLLEERLRFSTLPPEDPRRLQLSESGKEEIKGLLGKIAIANAKVAYRRFRKIFEETRFQRLKEQGARVQRPLWASTGTKNPHYSDVYYVEGLIGPGTVDTMPPVTYEVFKDHGIAKPTLEEDVQGAQKQLDALANHGIDFTLVTSRLQQEGVKSFEDSFTALMQAIDGKRETLLGSGQRRHRPMLASYGQPIEAAIQKAQKNETVQRIWAKDAGAWKKEDAHRRVIQNALGWLTVPDSMLDQTEYLIEFAERMKEVGFKQAVLLGMGGSSLCVEVLQKVCGEKAGSLRMMILDSTHPDSIRAIEEQIDLPHTLFIVASKSGSTVEPNVFFQYFYDRVRKAGLKNPGRSFVAITDPGTPMERLAREKKFRRIFLNPQDIGGRYSALSYFGMVPAALMGIDVKLLLSRSHEMIHACAGCVPAADNPGAVLGVTMGVLAGKSRDKLTLLTHPKLAPLGYWIEQLIAESTGKEGKGILPVEGETLASPAVYGNDRCFVYVGFASERDEATQRRLRALEKAGHPVLTILLRDNCDIGAEFFRWEFATAIAGTILGINAFDQPNVQESKNNTKSLLHGFETTRSLTLPAPVVSDNGIQVIGKKIKKGKSVDSAVQGFLAGNRKGDYFALLAYVDRNPHTADLLQSIRMALRDRTGRATTVGFGPRFLHSTGQLHKGGKNNGIFIQITSDVDEDLKIPGETFTFGTLISAQALGDYQSLSKRGRRLIRYNIAGSVIEGLERFLGIARKLGKRAAGRRAGKS